MVPTYFISPLAVVEMVSISFYVKTITYILRDELLLNNNNLENQEIQIVNALYRYWYTKENNMKNSSLKRKIELARAVISKTDFYGGKKNEKLDISFVNSLNKYVVTSMVFRDYSNIYGFLADFVRTTDDISVHSLVDRMLIKLSNEKLRNSDGSFATLEPDVASKIVDEYIRPLFPQTERNLSLISLDYLFAQAGAIALRCDECSPKIKEKHKKESYTEDNFVENLAFSHVMNYLMANKQVGKSVLKIFALPALLHYVYKEKERLVGISIKNIIKDSRHWRQAYKLLFSYINETSQQMEIAQKSDFRLHFYLSFASFKSRSTLARNAIKDSRKFTNDVDIEKEVDKYLKNPKNYKSKVGNTDLGLKDIDEIYKKQVSNITQEFVIYEKEFIRQLFGINFIKSLDKVNLKISQGHFFKHDLLKAFSIFNFNELDKTYEIYRFYFPDKDRVSLYGLIRQGLNISFFVESKNPVHFRKTFHFSSKEKFKPSKFENELKNESENFETFLNRISRFRMKYFEKSLYDQGYDKTSKDVFLELLQTLIPGYSCFKEILNNDDFNKLFFCPLEIIKIAVPVLGPQIAMVAHASYFFDKHLSKLQGKSFMSSVLEGNLQETILLNELLKADQFSNKKFGDLDTSVMRFVEPGIELFHDVGKSGIEAMKKTLGSLEGHSISLPGVMKKLEDIEKKVEKFEMKVGSGRKMYVMSLSRNAGYGYKFVHLPDGTIANVRQVDEREKMANEGEVEETEEMANEGQVEETDEMANEGQVEETKEIDNEEQFVGSEELPANLHRDSGNEEIHRQVIP